MSARSICAVVGLSSLSAAAGVACGNTSDGSDLQADAATSADAMAGQCPATVAQTLSARCTDEGLLCAPEYTCELIQVPLLCLCHDGVFACTDGSGNSLVAGETPSWAPASDAGCPLDENSANLAPCGEVGLVCEYPSACGLGVDTCQCIHEAAIDSGPSLLFQCQQTACVASEAGMVVVDPGPDAELGALDANSSPEVDATLDAGFSPDADASAEEIDSVDTSDSGG